MPVKGYLWSEGGSKGVQTNLLHVPVAFLNPWSKFNIYI